MAAQEKRVAGEELLAREGSLPGEDAQSRKEARGEPRKGPRLAAARSRPLATSFLMGLTAGTPFVVVVTLLQAWLKDGGVNLATIGALTLVGLPYSLKFVWAPVLDYFAPFGKRRHFWLVLSQLWILSSLMALSVTSPGDVFKVAILAFLVSFGSATQDIAVAA